jgi:SAM-dependent methyltransferase
MQLKFRATAGKLGEPALPSSHDRSKEVPLEPTSSFLQALGLTTPDGKPRPAMSSKLKQCQKFVEIVSGLVSASISAREVSSISTVDMGCGRGYLTFALHSYLHDKYGEMVRTCGIDVRPKLVKEVSDIARSLGSNFDGLTFQEGTIQGVLSEPQVEESSCLKVLIALHACDTATDDALWSGVQGGAHVIVVSPCCHKEVRRQLDRHVANVKSEHPLADILRHNIYRERIAETVTDSLRALLLELANYSVQVFEFIGGEHTGKNVMIAAVKRRRSRSEKELLTLRERLRALAKMHGVQSHCLATWMGETFEAVNDAPPKRKLSMKEMPPL